MMDKAHNSQNNRNMVNQSMPNRALPNKNELNRNKKPSIVDERRATNNDSLDDVMNELLDICQQYNDKLSLKVADRVCSKNNDQVVSSAPNAGTRMIDKCDTTNEHNDIVSTLPTKNIPKTEQICNSSSSQSGSIERLQQKQGELQAQLNEVLQVAKSLASKQKRKLKSILEDDTNVQKGNSFSHNGNEEGAEEEEEEDELIEFQQIENELRVSELNRQLDNIQEELRIRLYKRLLSNTGNTNKTFTQKNSVSSQDPIKRNHLHIEESSPSSSSCSDEPTTSSNSVAYYNSANSDLERIEEDEEDQDYYCDSDRFRTIYEMKLSPIIHSTQDQMNNKPKPDMNTDFISKQPTFNLQPQVEHNYMNSQQIIQNQQGIYTEVEPIINGSSNNDSSFNSSSSGRMGKSYESSRTSRPLTLYLPRPDEEIDLVEHIQALGHDLSMISNDLKLDTSCASGYLWKCCSNNNKKWLKRYFYFDRASQTLSYYENEAQLVKKNSSPKNCIQFDEISDVYVDHKLSGIGEKERSAKRKSYVFVLATTKRKYLLASSRAEIMRAWIDTLFTAAKANDYFQQISSMEDQYDNSYES